MRPDPLSIVLVCDPRDSAPPWAPPALQEHLRAGGHRVEIRSRADGTEDLAHALGWAAGRGLLSSDRPWVLTPGVEPVADADAIVAGAAAVLVASSEHAASVNRLGVPNFRLNVLPPAVDCATFTRLGPMANRTHRFRVVTPLSRDGEGVVRAVDALRYTPEAELVVVSSGASASLPVEAERLATSTGTRSRVAVVEARDDRERAWWLRSSHAALTLDDEVAEPGFVVEAMACGTPVVATPVDAQRELVVHGITGFHVPAGRPVSAAGALREIFADEFRVEAFGMAASDRALSSFDWPSVVRGMEAVYRRALGPATAEVDERTVEPDAATEIDLSA